MNRIMIQRWNEKVGPDDIVYHLGDFGMSQPKKWKNVFDQLNGSEKHLIFGNHDCKNHDYGELQEEILNLGFTSIQAELYKEIDGKMTWMHHLPDVSKDKRDLYRPKPTQHYDILLHGHNHDKTFWMKENVYNVGVDLLSFYPVTLQELIDESKKWPQGILLEKEE